MKLTGRNGTDFSALCTQFHTSALLRSALGRGKESPYTQYACTNRITDKVNKYEFLLDLTAVSTSPLPNSTSLGGASSAWQIPPPNITIVYLCLQLCMYECPARTGRHLEIRKRFSDQPRLCRWRSLCAHFLIGVQKPSPDGGGKEVVPRDSVFVFRRQPAIVT